MGDDGEGRFVSLEEVRKRSGVDGETGDTGGHSVGSAKGRMGRQLWYWVVRHDRYLLQSAEEDTR